MNKVINDLLNNIPGLIIAIFTSSLTAFLAARWSMKKFFKEKWWERKEKVYEDIINSLYDLLQYCEIEKEDYGQGLSWSEERMEKLSENYNRAYWQIKRLTAIGTFTYSDKVQKILQKLNNRKRLIWEENPSWEIYENDYIAYKEALDAIIIAAKEDLQAKNH